MATTGNSHDGSHLPLILAGRGSGTLKPGGNLTPTALADRRPCTLHLALMQRMGVQHGGSPIQRFGNSDRPLDGIEFNAARPRLAGGRRAGIARWQQLAAAHQGWATCV